MTKPLRLLLLSICMTWMPTLLVAQDTRALQDSLQSISEKLAANPSSTDLRLKKAGYNLLLEQWSYAKEEYDRILRYQPDNIAALYYRAYANEKLFRCSFARADYQHVLNIVPDHFEALLGLALLSQKTERKTEAYEQITHLVTLYPDSAVAYAAKADIENDLKMYAIAADDYSEAIKRDPANQDYLLARAELYILQGEHDKALKDLDRLVCLGVSRPALKPWYNRCKKK